jgi:hypothetical protein
MNIRHLDQLDCPTGRAKKCVDAKSSPLAPSTQQAEQSWLNTRAESGACRSIFLKLTKNEKQLDKNLELAGWYQTVPYLWPESQVERHIATKSYLSTD